MMGKTTKLVVTALAILGLTAVLAGCGASPASQTNGSQTAQNFYKGKTMQIIVPSGPGGGFDQWARLLAPYLQKYLDAGKVEVVNVPGAGGLIGTNKIYAAAPDGLTIGDTKATGDVFDQIANTPGAKFDVTKFNWIGQPDNDPHIIAVHPNGPYHSFTDLIKGQGAGSVVKTLVSGVGSNEYSAVVMTYNAFKVHYQMIGAFSGSKATKASFLSGNGDAIALSASDVNQIQEKAKVVLLMSNQPFAKLPDVPNVVALAQQEKLDPQSIQTLQAMASVMDLGHAFVAPPGVPPDRLEALKNAFKEAVQDPGLVDQATKAGLLVGYASPDRINQIMATALSSSDMFKSLMQAK